jgi:hypothetical protein
MLTCFIKNNFNNPNKDVAVYSILPLPLLYIFYAIYAFVQIFRRRKVQTDREFRVAVLKYLIYSLLYMIFYYPTILFFVISVNAEIELNTGLSWYSYFCSLSTISINLVLCLYRILEGYVKCDWKAMMVHQDLDESLMTEDSFENYPINDRKITVASTNTKGISYEKSSSKKKITLNSSWKKVSTEMIKGVKI